VRGPAAALSAALGGRGSKSVTLARDPACDRAKAEWTPVVASRRTIGAREGARCRGRESPALRLSVANPTALSRWARQASALIASVRDDAVRDELRLRFEERAAICEYDGKLPRAEAERIAYDALVSAARDLAGHVA